MSTRTRPENRSTYRRFTEIATRWMDNDAYAHVNNVAYYSFFDTAVNQFLVEGGFLDIQRSPVIGLVVESKCEFFSPLAFPDRIQAGLRVAHIGTSSVRYEIGIFRVGAAVAAAQGYFIHVYVDRETHRPAPLADELRRELRSLVPPVIAE